MPSMLETNRNVIVAFAVMLERLVRHHRAEVGAADADVDDVANPLAGVALPRAAADAVGRSPPSCRARRGPAGTTFSPSTNIDAPRGARSATCSTARFSVMLIFSPRNIASMRSRSLDSSASRQQQFDRFVGDHGSSSNPRGGLRPPTCNARRVPGRSQTAGADVSPEAPCSAPPGHSKSILYWPLWPNPGVVCMHVSRCARFQCFHRRAFQQPMARRGRSALFRSPSGDARRLRRHLTFGERHLLGARQRGRWRSVAAGGGDGPGPSD